MKKFLIQKNKGFTIIETLVAVFVLSVAITGPLVFAQSGLRASFLARDQIVALFLAQDAMESIKNLRDSNGIDNITWLQGISLCAGETSGCQIDTTSMKPLLTKCSGFPNGLCQKLKYTPDSGYQYSAGYPSSSDETIFRRTVYVDQTKTTEGSGSIANQYRIVVKVTWQSHERIGERSIVVQENIFNWIRI